MRNATVKRKTKETDIAVSVALDGAGQADIATKIGFFDHMLEQLARHSLIDISLKAKGDLHIDQHHTVEDAGIALGMALRQALGDLKGIARYADVHLPMDEALTRCAIDISGRPFLVWKVTFTRGKIGDFDTELFREFFRAFAQNAQDHVAYRKSVRSQQPSHCRDLLQGARPGVAGRGVDRSAPERPHPVDQGPTRKLERRP